MTALLQWAVQNLDVLDQTLISQNWKTSETLWALTTEEEAEFFKFFDQYEADLWHELNQSAEAQGNDPLELLNSWSDDQGITITSAESLKKQLLRWTMEKICRSRALAWGQ